MSTESVSAAQLEGFSRLFGALICHLFIAKIWTTGPLNSITGLLLVAIQSRLNCNNFFPILFWTLIYRRQILNTQLYIQNT